MLTYTRLADAARNGLLDLAVADDVRQITDYLCDEWVNDYARASPRGDLVEVPQHGFRYLFDIAKGA